MIAHYRSEASTSETKLTFQLIIIPTEISHDVERIITECIGADNNNIRFPWDVLHVVRFAKILLQLLYLQVTHSHDTVLLTIKLRQDQIIYLQTIGFENWVVDFLDDYRFLPPEKLIKLMKVVKKELIHVTAKILNASV